MGRRKLRRDRDKDREKEDLELELETEGFTAKFCESVLSNRSRSSKENALVIGDYIEATSLLHIYSHIVFETSQLSCHTRLYCLCIYFFRID